MKNFESPKAFFGENARKSRFLRTGILLNFQDKKSLDSNVFQRGVETGRKSEKSKGGRKNPLATRRDFKVKKTQSQTGIHLREWL